MSRRLRFGYDGDDGLGDLLLAAVLRGEKTATTSLAVEYLSGDPLPQVGERLTIEDHDRRGHGVVETTGVSIVPLDLVGATSHARKVRGSRTRAPGGGTTSPFGTMLLIWCALMPVTRLSSCARANPWSSTDFGCWRCTGRRSPPLTRVAGSYLSTG